MDPLSKEPSDTGNPVVFTLILVGVSESMHLLVETGLKGSLVVGKYRFGSSKMQKLDFEAQSFGNLTFLKI